MSSICRVMAVGVSSSKPSLFTTDSGIRLLLAQESHNALPIAKFPMVQGMVKLPRFCFFSGKIF